MLKQTITTIKILMILGLLAITLPSPADLNSEWQDQLNEFQWEIAENTDSIPTEPLDSTVELHQQLQEFQAKLKNRSVKIGIAYGVEKKLWLEWAVAEFKKMQFEVLGKDNDIINIELIRMGSVEGAETILKQDSDAKLIQVWIPASSLVRDWLVCRWKKLNNNQDPILSGTPLAYTPLVILMWEQRYKEFIAKYHQVDFNTIAQALSERTGWAAIADKPEWGIFTFGHTTPTHSNSGLLTLVLMAYNYYLSKPEGEDNETIKELELEQIENDNFVAWLKIAQKNIFTNPKTDVLMGKMLKLDPPDVESIIIYENLALVKLNEQNKEKKATLDEEAPDKLKIIYPPFNIWNDNPYYILNVPWNTQEQRRAAKLFQEFLLSENAQKVARDQSSFRPANSKIPLLEKGNLFDKFQNRVQIRFPKVPPLRAEVLEQILKIWESNENK